MSSIWAEQRGQWELLASVGFPDEATLHRLVEETPQLLPLAGSPRLLVLGREVSLGGGYADLLAVEPQGRLVLIEVKLARNAEARRAVVAQVLAYAAFLRGTALESLEKEVLRGQLRTLGYETIAALAESEDQDGSFVMDEFVAALSDSLRDGRFRLVLVLDDAPPELVRLVAYLESIAPLLVIDLVTVSAYEVNGSRVLVPQRIEPERETYKASPIADVTAANVKPKRYEIPLEEFEASISRAPLEQQAMLQRVFDWVPEDSLDLSRSARKSGLII